MKQIIYKILFVLCFLIVSVIGIKAQDKSAATFYKTNPDLIGFYPQGMSDNGRFIVCSNGSVTMTNVVKLWDTQTDKVTELGKNCWAYDVCNDGSVAVGQFLNPDLTINGKAVITAGYYRNGKWTMVDLYPDWGTDKMSVADEGSIWQISPDGKWMGGCLYYGKNKLKPVVWNGEGKYSHSFTIEGEQDYRAQLRTMSVDGKRAGGWSTRVGEMSLNGAWIPTFWTDTTSDPIAVPGSNSAGYIMGMNNSGTIGVGECRGEGVIVKDDGTITRMGTGFLGISETGIIVGSHIYSDNLGLWSIIDYLKILYGIEIPHLLRLTWDISDNGEYFCFSADLASGPTLVRLSGDVLPTVPQNLEFIGAENSSINASWETPRFNGYNPIGYNIYRDGVKINNKMIPSETLTYKDLTPKIGKNCYSVTAIYKYREDSAELESEKSIAQCVEVIAYNSCYSPKRLAADVIYNRTIKLTWQRPLPNYKSASNDDNNKIKPNMLKTFDVGAAMHAVSDGKYIYTLNFGPTAKYDLDGKFIDSFIITNGFLAGLTYDGTNFYTTIGQSILEFKEMKLNAEIIQHNIGIYSLSRISYLPCLNNNKGGFEVGSFTSPGSHLISKEYELLEGGLADSTCIMGSAYYDGILYVAKRDKPNGSSMKIYIYDPTTNKPTGKYIDMTDYTNLHLTNNDQIWGLSIMKSSEGIQCLTVIVGNVGTSYPGSNRLVFLEVGAMEGLKGYNVFRDGVKLNTDGVVTTPEFTDKIFEEGDYKYTVSAVFENSCESNKSDEVSVAITKINEVNVPKNLTTENVRNSIILSWSAPKPSTNPKLVGYNVFRDGIQLNKEGEYITDLFYTDKDLVLGTYKYEINSFYNNSAESEKIEATATITGFNPVLPPTDLAIADSRSAITLGWKAPTMGEYNVKTWHVGTVEQHLGIEGGGTFQVASKWDAKDLSSVFDYTLTDIEFYPNVNIPHTFYIYANNDLVGTQTMASVNAQTYNLLKLDKPIAIQKGKSLMVAYSVTHTASQRPAGADMRETTESKGKGDLMSEDGGKTWVSAATQDLIANWAISIRLMPYKTESPVKLENVEIPDNGGREIKLVSSPATDNICSITSKPIFKNTEVIGYNVYKNDTKVNSSIVTAESFTDSSADLSVNNCYSVEALFTADRKSAKSEKLCAFGYCFAPTFEGKLNGTYPELKLSVPYDITVIDKEIKFYDMERADAVGLFTTAPYYVFIKYNPAELQELDRLKITNISAFIAGKCSVSLYIKQGSEVVLNKSIPANKITVEAMNSFDITEDVTIDASKMILIGLKITAQSGVQIIGIDAGPAINFKSDVISMDGGETFSSLKDISKGQLNGNWNLSFKVEKREVLKEKLVGYNIYRNDVKINSTAVTENVYVDETAMDNKTYYYYATALWDTNCESGASSKVTIQTPVGVNDLSTANVKVYPNPAKDILNIEGDVETVHFYNSIGQECGRFSGNGKRGAGDYHRHSQFTVDVSNWSRGIYIIEVMSTTGEVNRGKVIIK